jgi:DNA segregation ATPase FtsK/SpoIIIE, S-DNA-T family
MATSKTQRIEARARLPHAKGSELLGLILATTALLLAASLASHHPSDPSFLHEMGDRDAATHNWVGLVGAQLSALFLSLVGLTALVFPLALWIPAWRRLRRNRATAVPGRGVGLFLTLLSLPILCHLAVGQTIWRGEALDSGGLLGRFLGDLLLVRLNYPGSLLLVVAVLLAGISLLVQSSLGEVLSAWRSRGVLLLERVGLLWARWRQRREKERLRRRVVAKHLRRREQEEQASSVAIGGGSTAVPGALGERLDLPLRVVERRGEGGFGLRRVRGAQESVAPGEALREAGKAASGLPPAERDRGPRGAEAQPLLFAPEPSQPSLPPLNLLVLDPPTQAIAETDLIRLGETIRQSCAQFGVDGTLEGISPGPVITVYEFKPAPGVKMSQIVNLQDDLALALRAESVRIDRMPGRSTLGIEVPNQARSLIRLGALLAHERFRRSPSVLTMALGTDIHGEPYFADLATMPHLLVAGATGSGKSVGLQSMITSILFKATREEVQFIFIDPKRVELGVYEAIPHLKTEVVVEPKKAANALRWAVAEMERRYRLLAEVHVRSIGYYNRAIRDPEVKRRLALEEGREITEVVLEHLPYYVIVIDELADLMMVAAAEVESSIARLAQMARAVGIHLIVATQRPSVDVITGTIKANFPCRMAFATTSRHDSRTILDTVGSERLLGQGDLLLMPPGTSRLLRLHGAYISEQETASLIRWLKKQGRPELDPEVVRFNEAAAGASGEGEGDDDDLYEEAARLVVSEKKASASFLQRRMRIGFSRASRLIDLMERDGLLGPAQGSKPREVLVEADYFAEIDARD